MKLVKLQNLVAKCLKLRKYSLAKLQILYMFVITCGNCYHFRLKSGNNLLTYKYKHIQNMQTLQGYIFRILQHFVTKFCNFTNFKDHVKSVLRIRPAQGHIPMVGTITFFWFAMLVN